MRCYPFLRLFAPKGANIPPFHFCLAHVIAKSDSAVLTRHTVREKIFHDKYVFSVYIKLVLCRKPCLSSVKKARGRQKQLALRVPHEAKLYVKYNVRPARHRVFRGNARFPFGSVNDGRKKPYTKRRKAPPLPSRRILVLRTARGCGFFEKLFKARFHIRVKIRYAGTSLKARIKKMRPRHLRAEKGKREPLFFRKYPHNHPPCPVFLILCAKKEKKHRQLQGFS